MSLICGHVTLASINISSFGLRAIIEFEQQVQFLERNPLSAPPRKFGMSLLGRSCDFEIFPYTLLWMDYTHQILTAGSPFEGETIELFSIFVGDVITM